MAKLGRAQGNPITKSGVEITPEVEKELAAEAERGYDLSKAKRVRIGRPPLGDAGPSPRLSFRVSPELYRGAREQAEQEGRSVSDLAREAVARYVRSQRGTAAPTGRR